MANPVTPQPAGGGPVRMIRRMIAQGREFLDAEPDSDDRAVMQGILDGLEQLARKEEAEGILPGKNARWNIAAGHVIAQELQDEDWRKGDAEYEAAADLRWKALQSAFEVLGEVK